jgi:predicted aconitase
MNTPSEESIFESQARYFRVNRHDLVYLKFILEAYEGLATLSTVEREGAIVRIGYPHFSAADVDALLLALSGEIQMKEVPMPAGHAEGLPQLPVRKVAEHA